MPTSKHEVGITAWCTKTEEATFMLYSYCDENNLAYIADSISTQIQGLFMSKCTRHASVL